LQYGDDAPVKKSNPCPDSIDILSDMLDSRRSVNSQLDNAEPDLTEFRLLFGSPAKSCSSSNTSNDGGGLIVEEPVSGSIDSSYEQSNSEGIDLCGSLEGMTQDDRDVMKNYAAECKPILYYLSEGENGDCNIQLPVARAENIIHATSVPQVIDELAERSDNENQGEALVGSCVNNNLEKSADLGIAHRGSFTAMDCGKFTAMECSKRARNATDNGIKGDVIDTHPYRKKRKSLKDINEDFSTKHVYDPEQLHDKASVANLDVIVIADDDEAEPVYVTEESLGFKGFSLKLHSIGSRGVDSDATTVDVNCSPCNFELAASSSDKNRTVLNKLSTTCFDSDATTVDNTSPRNIISPVKVSVGGSSLPPELASFNQSSVNSASYNVSSMRDTASSADDLLIYLDSPQVSETSRWASWSSVQASCSNEYPAVQLARKKRKYQKFIKSSYKTKRNFPSKETKFCDDYSDVTYEADSESELNQAENDDVYLPEFCFKRLQLAQRVSPPTSSDSDDDVTHEYARKLVFDRSFKRSSCSSPWSSWSNEDVGQHQNSRLCGSDSEAQHHVVLISDDER